MPILTTSTSRKTIVQMVYTTVKELCFSHLDHKAKVALTQHFANLEADPRNLNATCKVSEQHGVTKVEIALSAERRIPS